jgi:hypothetical protein
MTTIVGRSSQDLRPPTAVDAFRLCHAVTDRSPIAETALSSGRFGWERVGAGGAGRSGVGIFDGTCSNRTYDRPGLLSTMATRRHQRDVSRRRSGLQRRRLDRVAGWRGDHRGSRLPCHPHPDSEPRNDLDSQHGTHDERDQLVPLALPLAALVGEGTPSERRLHSAVLVEPFVPVRRNPILKPTAGRTGGKRSSTTRRARQLTPRGGSDLACARVITLRFSRRWRFPKQETRSRDDDSTHDRHHQRPPLDGRPDVRDGATACRVHRRRAVTHDML